MATQRFISTSFWDDEWVITLSPQEKLVYLYLMTNTLTNIAGVYKITLKRMAYDTDMDRTFIEKTLERFEEDKKAYYFGEYIVIPSWPKHQKTERHPKLKSGIFAVLDSLSVDVIIFLKRVNYAFDLSKYDSLSEAIDTERLSSNYSDLDSDTDNDTDTYVSTMSGKPDDVGFHWEVLEYLNQRCGKQFRRVHAHGNKIKARIKEGYTLEDFKKVIDSQHSQWGGKEDFEKYLRPETLFGTKFDSYLAQAKPKIEAQTGSAPKMDDDLKEMIKAVGEAYARVG
jgi:uncharacterized phage protein (TIGR02220 family)